MASIIIPLLPRFHAASAADGAEGEQRGADLPPLVDPNTDSLRLPTVEEMRIQDEQDEAGISLTLGKFMLLGADILWLVLSLALTEDFRWSIVGLIAIDLLIAFRRQPERLPSQLELVARGLMGVALFTFEAVFFGAPWPLALGQVLLLAAAALQAFGAGGEGKNLLGGLLVVCGVIFAMALSMVLAQLRDQEIFEQYESAYLLAAAGRRDDALAVVSRIIEENPTDAEVYIQAVNFYMTNEISDPAAAALASDRAVEYADGDTYAQAHYVRGFLQEQRQDYQSALESYTRAIEDRDDIPLLYLTRANIYIQLGRTQEAIADLEKIEELAPGTDAATEARIMRLNLQPASGNPFDDL